MPHSKQCGNWSATLHHKTLKVQGECTFPTPGYKAELKRREPQGINPAILLLEKTVTPPTGIVAQHVVTQMVTFEEHTSAHYHEVQILPDGVMIEVKQAVSV
jgi:hypothetical protein